KVLNIKCRQSGLAPAACVVVATIRALKMHGGVGLKSLAEENIAAVQAGCANLLRHVENMRGFGLPVIVAINRFTGDIPAELAAIITACAGIGVTAIACNHWAEGAAGASALAGAILDLTATPSTLSLSYPDGAALPDKISLIATRIYRAAGITISPQAQSQLRSFASAGFDHLPVCMAKTQYSFSADPTAKGAPTQFTLNIREVRLSAGAGFIVALCGEVMTMPGLPRHPAAESIFLDEHGDIGGLS
ncbi:MAG: formate--tetrahydrofolate ligase, partial [Acidocella sp.]|nr:formate--tetrahydrofolate ligase [Acidocella sp.]